MRSKLNHYVNAQHKIKIINIKKKKKNAPKLKFGVRGGVNFYEADL